MAAFDTFRPISAAPLTGRLTLTSLVATFAAWNDARVTRKALNQLTARELDDIGLSRGEIEAMVRSNKR